MLASSVIRGARDEVDVEADDKEEIWGRFGGERHEIDAEAAAGAGAIARAETRCGLTGGGVSAACVALDWAAAMERDAFDAAAMEHAHSEEADGADGGGSERSYPSSRCAYDLPPFSSLVSPPISP